MANHLSQYLQKRVIHDLAEGSSIRSIERKTGVHRDTIMRHAVSTGVHCGAILDRMMRNLPTVRVQVDEIYGFIGCKPKTAARSLMVSPTGAYRGEIWTWVAIDADNKVVPNWHVGGRTTYDARVFLDDLKNRIPHKINLSSDALLAYHNAVEYAFGSNVNYGQIVKAFHPDPSAPHNRYAPAEVVNVTKTLICGDMSDAEISTSYVERQNLTMRMHIRRLTRLTNAFSKKLANFKAAVALHFGYYNLCKIHSTLRMTPAMAAGVTDHVWEVEELLLP